MCPYHGVQVVGSNLLSHGGSDAAPVHFVESFGWAGLHLNQQTPELQGLEVARCLDDVRAAHAAYLHAVRRLRLSNPERDWHVVASAVTAVLNAVLQFCALVRSSRRERDVRPLLTVPCTHRQRSDCSMFPIRRDLCMH